MTNLGRSLSTNSDRSAWMVAATLQHPRSTPKWPPAVHVVCPAVSWATWAASALPGLAVLVPEHPLPGCWAGSQAFPGLASTGATAPEQQVPCSGCHGHPGAQAGPGWPDGTHILVNQCPASALLLHV